MIVVLLNFLIAVITQTYESVYGKKVIYIYNDKAALNKEYFQIMDEITSIQNGLKYIFRCCKKKRDGLKKSLKFMVLTISSDLSVS